MALKRVQNTQSENHGSLESRAYGEIVCKHLKIVIVIRIHLRDVPRQLAILSRVRTPQTRFTLSKNQFDRRAEYGKARAKARAHKYLDRTMLLLQDGGKRDRTQDTVSCDKSGAARFQTGVLYFCPVISVPFEARSSQSPTQSSRRADIPFPQP